MRMVIYRERDAYVSKQTAKKRCVSLRTLEKVLHRLLHNSSLVYDT